MNKKIIIAGAGIAGLNAAKSAREANPDCEIMMIEASSDNTYIRTRLPEYLSGEINKTVLFPYDDNWFISNKVTIAKNKTITAINPDSKTVTVSNTTLYYDSLILALGSSPFIPPINGVEKRNVFSVRTLADAENIKALAGNGVSCTIIGGGLLGLEIAWSIKQLGCKVNIVEHNPRLLPRQADAKASELLINAIQKVGINVYLNAQVEEICGEECVDSVRLKDKRIIASDIVILSTGVKANVDVLKDSGIDIGRAVKINEFCQTNIPSVYAAGDIAEFNGFNYCIWPISIAQGKVAGHNAALENLSANNNLAEKNKYTDIKPFTNLKIKGISMFSIGDISTNQQEVFSIDEASNKYINFFIQDNHIKGAIAFGEPSLTLKIKKAVDQNKSIISQNNEIAFDDIINSL